MVSALRADQDRFIRSARIEEEGRVSIGGDWQKRRVGNLEGLGGIDRRTFVKLSGMSAAALTFGLGPFTEEAVARTRFSDYPFVTPTPSANGFTINHDQNRGRIYLENSVLKLEFGYKAEAQTHYNQSGGDLYQYFDKRFDPNTNI